jgi:chromosome segregation ATPase
MGEMTKDEVNVGLFEECKRLQAKVKELEAELAKHQGSTFHPDWSLLEATRDTVEELKRELKIANTFAVSRRKTIADLQAKVDELEATLALLLHITKDDKNTIAELQTKVEELEATIEANYMAMNKQAVRIEELQAEVEELEGSKDDPWTYWRRRSKQLQAEVERLKSYIIRPDLFTKEKDD